MIKTIVTSRFSGEINIYIVICTNLLINLISLINYNYKHKKRKQGFFNL